jgi:hypothetical protein
MISDRHIFNVSYFGTESLPLLVVLRTLDISFTDTICCMKPVILEMNPIPKASGLV